MRFVRSIQVVLLGSLLWFGAASCSDDAEQSTGAGGSDSAATTGAASQSGGMGGSMATGGMGGSMATGGGMGGSMATGDHLWSKRFGEGSADESRSVAVDSAGNVLITGEFRGTVDFGGGGLTSAGQNDIFLAKYDAAGNHLWSKRFGAASFDRGYSVAVDSAGNVLVTGYFRETVDFGGGGLTSAGNLDIFLAKYDAAGGHLWSKRFGAPASDQGYSVAVDSAGNVLVTGFFVGTVDFGDGGLTSAGDFDVFLAKYDAAGNHLWSKRFGGGGGDYGYSVAVDSAGNVLVTGGFGGTVDFGGGGLTSAGLSDIFVAKYDSTGGHLWSKRFGAALGDYGNSVAVDSGGNVLVTGYFTGTVDFGGGGLTSAGNRDIFVAKYDAAANHLWSKRFGAATDDRGYSVAVDSAGNVLVTGDFLGTVDFGGGGLTSAGSADIFLAKYDAAGGHLWSKRFGAPAPDRGYSVAVDSAGNVLVTGDFHGTVDFGGGDLTSAGSADIFVAKYSP